MNHATIGNIGKSMVSRLGPQNDSDFLVGLGQSSPPTCTKTSFLFYKQHRTKNLTQGPDLELKIELFTVLGAAKVAWPTTTTFLLDYGLSRGGY